MKELLLIVCLLVVGSVAGKVYIIENRPQNASGTNTTNNYYYNITNNITTYYNTTTYVNVTNNITSNDGTGGWVNDSTTTNTTLIVKIENYLNATNIYDTNLTPTYIPLASTGGRLSNSGLYADLKGVAMGNVFVNITAYPGFTIYDNNNGALSMRLVNGGTTNADKAQITVGQALTGSNYAIFQHWGTNMAVSGVQIPDRTGLMGYDTQGMVVGTGTASGTDRDLLFATLNTERMRIESAGLVGIGTDTTPDAQLAIDSQAAANIGLIVQGAASQSGDLTQWQNSGGTVLARVTAAGKIGIGTTTPEQMIDVFGTDPTIGFGSGGVLWRMGMESGKFKIVHTGVQEMVSFSNDTLPYSSWGGAVGIETTEHWRPSATLTVNNTNATRQTSVFYAPLNTQRNITEWKNSSGATLAYINSTGEFFEQTGRTCTAANGLCNETTYINTKAGTGTCASGYVVQNVTTGGVQCILDQTGGAGGNPFDQWLNTTSTVQFSTLTLGTLDGTYTQDYFDEPFIRINNTLRNFNIFPGGGEWFGGDVLTYAGFVDSTMFETVYQENLSDHYLIFETDNNYERTYNRLYEYDNGGAIRELTSEISALGIFLRQSGSSYFSAYNESLIFADSEHSIIEANSNAITLSETTTINSNLNVEGNVSITLAGAAIINNGKIGLTTNITLGPCWQAFTGGILTATNCTIT